MAATDKTYRSQPILNIVFAVSCVLMFVSIIWMLADDYWREWKGVQRLFRQVETLVNQRHYVNKSPRDVEEAERQVDRVVEAREKEAAERANLRDKLRTVLADYAKLEEREQALKAIYDSEVSYRDIEIKKVGPDGIKATDEKLKKLNDDYLEAARKSRKRNAKRKRSWPI